MTEDPVPPSTNPSYASQSRTVQNKSGDDPAWRKYLLFFGIVPVIATLGAIGLFNLIRAQASKPVNPTPVVASPDKDAEIAQLKTEIESLRAPTSQTATQPLLTASAQAQNYAISDSVHIANLEARLTRLESAQRYLSQYIATASAASELEKAARGSRPFLTQLAVIERASDDAEITVPLRNLAEKGVPSIVELSQAYPKMAAQANIAAKAEKDGDDLLSRLKHGFTHLISIRHVDNAGGQGSEALLYRAELRLDQGDLAGATTLLKDLPPSARTAMKPWLDHAANRLQVDSATQAITARALSRLSHASEIPATSFDTNGTRTHP